MNIWQKLIVLVMILACFIEDVVAKSKPQSKKAAKPAPSKKASKSSKKSKKD